MKTNRIKILIPCLNEEKTVEKVIHDFKLHLPEAILHVFDNNSDDNSKKIAQSAGAIVHDVKYLGKGNVVRRMFADVEGDIFVMIDADDTYDISNIKNMINTLEKESLDMIVAKRVSIEKSAYRFGHVFGNKIFSDLVKITFGKQITDLFSGFRIFSKRFIIAKL